MYLRLFVKCIGFNVTYIRCFLSNQNKQFNSEVGVVNVNKYYQFAIRDTIKTQVADDNKTNKQITKKKFKETRNPLNVFLLTNHNFTQCFYFVNGSTIMLTFLLWVISLKKRERCNENEDERK